jgi:arylsulfatase
MKRLSEGSVIDIKKPVVECDGVDRRTRRRSSQWGADRAGGQIRWLGVLPEKRRAKFVYNVLGMQEFITGATEDLTPGRHQVRAEFTYDGGGLAKRGTVTLYYDGTSVGPGRVNVTQPLIFSADETTDIGNDYRMPVSTDYGEGSRFNGRIDVVQIDVGDDDQSHLIDPEQVAMIAISRL